MIHHDDRNGNELHWKLCANEFLSHTFPHLSLPMGFVYIYLHTLPLQVGSMYNCLFRCSFCAPHSACGTAAASGGAGRGAGGGGRMGHTLGAPPAKRPCQGPALQGPGLPHLPCKRQCKFVKSYFSSSLALGSAGRTSFKIVSPPLYRAILKSRDFSV